MIGPHRAGKRSKLGMTARIERGEDGLKRGVSGDQVGGEQVLLRVVAVGEIARVVVWQEHVVNSDQHSVGQPWKDLEEEDRRIRVHECAVRSVEEDHVTAGELVEHGQVRGLEDTRSTRSQSPSISARGRGSMDTIRV